MYIYVFFFIYLFVYLLLRITNRTPPYQVTWRIVKSRRCIYIASHSIFHTYFAYYSHSGLLSLWPILCYNLTYEGHIFSIYFQFFHIQLFYSCIFLSFSLISALHPTLLQGPRIQTCQERKLLPLSLFPEPHVVFSFKSYVLSHAESHSHVKKCWNNLLLFIKRERGKSRVGGAVTNLVSARPHSGVPLIPIFF